MRSRIEGVRRGSGAGVGPWASLHETRHVLQKDILSKRLLAQSAPVLASRRPGPKKDKLKVFCRVFPRNPTYPAWCDGYDADPGYCTSPALKAARVNSHAHHDKLGLQQPSQTCSAKPCSNHCPKRGMSPVLESQEGHRSLLWGMRRSRPACDRPRTAPSASRRRRICAMNGTRSEYFKVSEAVSKQPVLGSRPQFLTPHKRRKLPSRSLVPRAPCTTRELQRVV